MLSSISLTYFCVDVELDQIRLISRNHRKINENDELVKADLTQNEEVDQAVEGSEMVYLTVGLPYKTKVWQTTWPPLIRNVINACKKHGAKLVFFDNVYMYDPDYLQKMTEETPVRPVSKKGKVRAEIAQMLMDEVDQGKLTALVARSADFLGTQNSVPIEVVYKNFKKGRKAQWFPSADKIHSFTYVPDAGKATAMLGNTPSAFNDVWHLPTDATPIKGKHWIELFARVMDVDPSYSVIPNWMLSILGLFMPFLHELKEMNYQYERDYVFDSSKFEAKFDFTPTQTEDAVKGVVAKLDHQ